MFCFVELNVIQQNVMNCKLQLFHLSFEELFVLWALE